MKFDVYADPGHAWAKCPKATLKELGIAEKITAYSYQRGEFAYLEEDCDASTLVSALKANGIPHEFVLHQSNSSSRIRNYERYQV